MSASVTSVAQASPPRATPTRDPPRLQALSALLTLLLASLLIRGGDSLAATIVAEWKSLLFWSALVMLVSFFPINVDDALLTLDEPILLALALLYPPEVAALVAVSASVDVREFKGQIVFARALYNHAQVGLSVYLAGAAFRFVADGSLDPWPVAAIGTGAAVAAEFIANVLLASLHARARWRMGWRAAVRKMKVGQAGQFLATHLGYGTLALVIAHLFLGVGPWSVASFFVPILVARQMLVRGQAIELLAEQLRHRDHLLKRVSERILDERRDERRRLAGDLHDDTLQALTRLWLLARVIQKQPYEDDSKSEDFEELVRISETSIESLRHIIHDLRESQLARGGLRSMLEGLVQDARLEWQAKIRLELPTTLRMSPESQIVVYQVAREGLGNALRHAQASQICVRLYPESGWLTLEIKDNGNGFRPEFVDSSEHFGLALLEERVERIGGNLSIESSPHKGTTVRARFPGQEHQG